MVNGQIFHWENPRKLVENDGEMGINVPETINNSWVKIMFQPKSIQKQLGIYDGLSMRKMMFKPHRIYDYIWNYMYMMGTWHGFIN